jgi:D-3-phosphoglycerate dehydrogenase
MKVLVADPIADEGVERLRQGAEVDVKTKLSAEELCAEIRGYDALVVRSQTRVTADIIECGQNLRVIGRAGVGVDNIDVQAATRHGIVVVNAPSGNTVSAAEHTMALMLSLARNVSQADSQVRNGVWARNKLTGTELRGKTLGIVGLGNIGRQVALRAQSFEMKTIAYDPFVSADYAKSFKVQLTELEDLFRQSDFITLHIPLSPATTNLIGREQIEMMKPSVRIVNCARGGVVDEAAVAEALANERIAGAAFDVFVNEPPTDSPLLSNPKTVLTPHLGASTVEAQTNVAIDVAGEVLTVLDGRMSRCAVNAPHASAELMPYLQMCMTIGSFASQLMDGQIRKVSVRYCGDLSTAGCDPLKAAVIAGILQQVTEQRVNLVNADLVAQQRGLRLAEENEPTCGNYSNMITVTVESDSGTTTVSGTVRDGEVRVVQVNDFWMDLNLADGHYLLCDHIDGPGLVGAIGTILGTSGINISSMNLSRVERRGRALLIMALDEALGDAQRAEIRAIPNIHTAKTVSLGTQSL